MTAPDDAKWRGRRQLVLIGSIFIVPVLTVIVLYHSLDWRPVVNSQGTLIEPPPRLTAAGLRLPNGDAAPADAFEGLWSVIRPVAGACGSGERELMEELARVRLALGKDADRLRRVVVHAGACDRVALEDDESDLRVYSAGGDAAFLAQFPPAVDGSAGIYMADPHGNLILSYPAAGSARGLLKDLERLLRLSSIG